jgi:hypothetical protein
MSRRFLSFRDFDWWLLGMVLLLCILSVTEIYTATLHTKYAGFHTKQIAWILGGLVAMFVFSRIDYHKLIGVVPWLYGTFVVFLVAVLIPHIGHKALGARRWIKLGPILFQPSEWMKLVLILAVARYFANLGGRSLSWREIFKAFALVGIPMLLVLKQPDLGTTLTYLPILVAGLFLGGINTRQALTLVTAAALVVGIGWSSGKLLKPYQKARLTSRLRGRLGQGRRAGHADTGGFSSHSARRLHLCRFQRGARLCGRNFCAAAILLHIDAFDSKRSNSRRPARLPHYYGGSGCVDLPDCGQRWHGHRVYARHRNPFTVNELRRIFGALHLPGAGRVHECPHAPVRELGVLHECAPGSARQVRQSRQGTIFL